MTFDIAHCKNCGQEQKYIRIPKNWRQLLWGGYTCPKCNAELDTEGNVLKMPDETKHDKPEAK